MGNIKSVCNALKYLKAEPVIAKKTDDIEGEKIIIPGVGAFGDAMKNLKPLIPKIKELSDSGIPILGICLGLEIFFESSEENPDVKGLGLIKGKVIKIPTKLKLPQIGWNQLKIKKSDCPLFKEVEGYVYFVHSYHASPEEDVIAATTDYGCEVTAAVWKKNIFGTQFHPEKSGSLGLRILKNFLEV